MGKIELEAVSCVALDTAVFIYYIEAHSRYFPLIEPVINAIDESEITAITSAITLTEALVLPLRLGDHNIVQQYRSILLDSNLTLTPVSSDVAQKAAEIRANHNFRTPDAIQIATAILGEADLLIANDKKWRQISDLPIVVLDELLSDS